MPPVDAAQHHQHQQGDRSQLDHRIAAERAQRDANAPGGFAADEARRDDAQRHDGGTESDRKQDPWKNARQEHRPNGLFGDHGVDDQHHAGRNDHAEHRTAGNDAHREALAVAILQHLRYRHLGEHRG